MILCSRTQRFLLEPPRKSVGRSASEISPKEEEYVKDLTSEVIAAFGGVEVNSEDGASEARAVFGGVEVNDLVARLLVIRTATGEPEGRGTHFNEGQNSR